MDMSGEYRIPASRQTVWEALNDPEILKQAIPGCETLTKTGDNELAARVRTKVGPVSATFNGTVTLGDLNPPESYTITGEGSGGVAGFAKGGAKVRLTEEDATTTTLRYEAHADVGGKLAQIGSRLVQGTAKKTADEFFSKFTALLSAPAAAAATPILEAPPALVAEPVAAASVAPVGPPLGAPPTLPSAAPPIRTTTSVPPASSPRPVTPPAPAPGFFSKPLNLVIVALVVLVLLWLIL